MAVKKEVQEILVWAREAVEWAANNDLLMAVGLTPEKQWIIDFIYKYHKKFHEK